SSPTRRSSRASWKRAPIPSAARRKNSARSCATNTRSGARWSGTRAPGWSEETTMEMLPLKSMKDRCTPAEWKARIDLAACYRLVAHYDMSDMMANHISLRVPEQENAFLINAYGMLYEEITASSLIKIDLEGNILAKPDFGDLDYGINKAG